MDVGVANPRRRRGLGIVTPNACTECRKKRAKCDGQAPCGRCEAQSVECIYEIPMRQSKENMRSEIETLRSHQVRSDRILAALVSSDTSEQVLQQLRDGKSLLQIQEQLDSSGSSTSPSEKVTIFQRRSDQNSIRSARTQEKDAEAGVNSSLSPTTFGDSQRSGTQEGGSSWHTWGTEDSGTFSDLSIKEEDMMAWDSDISPSIQSTQPPIVGSWLQHSSGSTPDHVARHARGEGQAIILGPTFGTEEHPGQHHPNYNQSWTTVTDDAGFVEHLLALYFCWEYPTFASLSKEHFLDDFRSGNQRYCSSLLVNAILALGCRFSNEALARANPLDSSTAGDHFFNEANQILERNRDRHKLTTVQALGLMSIREASCGRTSQSLYLSGQSIRLAVEMGLHQVEQNGTGKDAEVRHAVQSATFWGAFSLDQAWSLSLGHIPHFSRDLRLVTKPRLVEHVEASSWVPYTDEGMPHEKSCTQPSNVRSVFKTFCELSELVHSSLYTLYAPGSRVSSKTLMQSYTSYLRWYEAIPTTLRLGHNFTPAVLFAHMYYHFAILLLFRPFIKLGISGSGVSPRDMCIQAADAISTLVNSYSKLYTLRRTPSFVPYFVLTSGIAHLIGVGSHRSGPTQLRQSIADLKEMGGCHGFANRALEVLHFLVRHWEVENILEDADADAKMICRPKTTSLNLFCPNISNFDMISGIAPVKADINPLFWPFPLQGRPLLEIGDHLESAGFMILS